MRLVLFLACPVVILVIPCIHTANIELSLLAWGRGGTGTTTQGPNTVPQLQTALQVATDVAADICNQKCTGVCEGISDCGGTMTMKAMHTVMLHGLLL